jgi:hypothetical protein
MTSAEPMMVTPLLHHPIPNSLDLAELEAALASIWWHPPRPLLPCFSRSPLHSAVVAPLPNSPHCNNRTTPTLSTT